MIAILTGLRWYLIVVLMGISRMVRDVEHPFMCLLSVCLLLKNVYSGLLPIFNWVVCFFWYWVVGAVYIFWILSPCWSYHLQIFFSHSVGYLFVFLMVSFAVQKLLSLIRSIFCLLFFAFISFALGGPKKKNCYNLCQRMFCLCSLLGVLRFQVLHLGL